MKPFLENLTRCDQLFFRAIFGLNPRPLVYRFFWLLTRTADGHLYPPILLLAAFLAPPESQTSGARLPLAAGLAFAIELPLYKILKNTIRRDRPFETLEGIVRRIIPPDQFSFPSGHTAAAFVMATLISGSAPGLTLPLYLWASLVGLSRIYLGVHYPSDVFVGALIGTASALFGLHIAL